MHLSRKSRKIGQGNALTGQFYVVNQDPALKAVQAKFPNVDIEAIQDDIITIFGDPEDFFDEIERLRPQLVFSPT